MQFDRVRKAGADVKLPGHRRPPNHTGLAPGVGDQKTRGGCKPGVMLGRPLCAPISYSSRPRMFCFHALLCTEARLSPGKSDSQYSAAHGNRTCAAGLEDDLNLPKYVPILNADASMYSRHVWLLDGPQDVGLHYVADSNGKTQTWTCLVDYWKSRGIDVPHSTCPYCNRGLQPSYYCYLPVASIEGPPEAKRYRPAILQITMPFRICHEERLVRGRKLIVKGRGKGVPPGIDVQELANTTQLPESFDCDSVLARMKLGHVPTVPPATATPRGDDILEFERRRQA
jgi:hypothetical protein